MEQVERKANTLIIRMGNLSLLDYQMILCWA